MILKMLTGIWSGLGMPIGLPLVGGLARLVGILAGLAGLVCLAVILTLKTGFLRWPARPPARDPLRRRPLADPP
jgi:uncharacterized iron-regulated membrane protein